MKLKDIQVKDIKVGDLLFWEEKTHGWTNDRGRLFGIILKIKKDKYYNLNQKLLFTVFFNKTIYNTNKKITTFYASKDEKAYAKKVIF